ncbi:hypothetical protein BCR37DRAFT_375740 [Protomyces lactucae-debilis]|uniref:Uncharacterized protein n=1 Tax=Protomyces lactucae-debilis TaxID=2754530 RepID=A0A1Y2FUZ4_PROLT|nr:uncharacterized protein BCR37DRAFT_375740 [Protomyces lactucae-debilis]ORY87831.1 hypothetical protein BCR37DRAFT_375740 [Protomyces lactucae-debilis]
MVYSFGQTRAAAYLSSVDAEITGQRLEQPAGWLLSLALLIFSITLSSAIMCERIPSSKEQRFAMTPVDVAVLAISSLTWTYAAYQSVYRLLFALPLLDMRVLCLIKAFISNSITVMSLYVFLFITLETARQINYPGVKRMKCGEYQCGLAAMLLLFPLVPMCFYRVSSTPRGTTCVIGMPRDITVPWMVAIALHNAYAALRICLPLLTIDNQRLRAWAISSAIAVVLCICGCSVVFTLIMVCNEYFYYTHILCLMQSGLTLMSSAAYIMTWRPAYKVSTRECAATLKSISEFLLPSESVTLTSTGNPPKCDSVCCMSQDKPRSMLDELHGNGHGSSELNVDISPSAASHFKRWMVKQDTEYDTLPPSPTISWSSAAAPRLDSTPSFMRRNSSSSLPEVEPLQSSLLYWKSSSRRRSLAAKVDDLEDERRRVASTVASLEVDDLHAQEQNDLWSNWPPVVVGLGPDRDFDDQAGSYNVQFQERSIEFRQMQGSPSPAKRAAFLSAPAVRGRTALRASPLA